MAGFVLDPKTDQISEFHIDTVDSDFVNRVKSTSRVVNLQLDGDELDAALWGLEHYKKPPFTVEELLDYTFGPQPPAQVKIEVTHARDCPCPIKDCYASPRLKRSVEI